MENFDSLFSNQQQCSEQPFDKKQWAQQKQEKRQELYDTIDEMADRTLSEPEMLAAYIKTQARLGMTSVANTLLIAAQKPEASYVMSYDDWTQKGRSVKRGENGFFILEANGEYTREDGSLATSYDAKCVFDISQTHGKPIQQRATLSMPLRSKLKALMTDAPVPIKPSENVTESVGALYSQEDNTIYVARTSNWNKLFFVVARELAREEQGDNTFICDCTANIVCERFGVPSVPCDQIPDELSALDVREKRSVLGIVREAAWDINERVDRNLYTERQQTQSAGKVGRYGRKTCDRSGRLPAWAYHQFLE